MFGKKPQLQTIAGVDIGSTSVRIVIGQVGKNDGGENELRLLEATEVNSEGVHKGVINSIEETVSTLSHGLEQTERMVGLPIESAWVGMGGVSVIFQESKGVVAVAKADGEIGEEDVERAVEAASVVAPPLNYEMLHVIPRGFVVDGQIGIKDPVGMTGIRLEVTTRLVHGLTSHLKNIKKAIYRTGIDIDNIVFSILSTGNVVTSPRQRDLGTAVVNIGAGVTTLIVYEGGEVIHVAALPIGSEHVTNDLAIGLRTSIDIAERVKINYGHCLAREIDSKEKIDLAGVGAPESEEVPLRKISYIVEARMSEILEKVNNELALIQRAGMLPGGVLFTGGGAKINGLVNLGKKVLALPVALGYPVDVLSSTEKINDLSYTTAVGLVKWGAGLRTVSGKGKKLVSFSNLGSFGVKIKNLFKTLIP